MLVLALLSRVMVPPLPLRVAFAFTTAPGATVTVRAIGAVARDGPAAARASVVPSATVPPPLRPETSIFAAAATVTPPSASACTPPPVEPRALRSPCTTSDPPTPFSTMLPPGPLPPLVEIFPPAVTRLVTMPSAAAAVSVIVPPWARIVPVLVTSAVTFWPSAPTGTCLTWPVTSIASSPSPYRSTVWVVAPASTTWPMRALMTPWFATAGATSAASPLCLTVIVPLLMTIAFGLPGMEKLVFPAMKALLAMSAVEITSELTLTWLPCSNTTPDGLTSTTLPLAVMRPAIAEGSGPTTRFSVVALALGCWKVTLCAEPTLKLCQSTAARELDCCTVVTVVVWLMLACPATTWPPCGCALGGSGPACAGSPSTSSTAACSAVLPSNAARRPRSVAGIIAFPPPRRPAILHAAAIPSPRPVFRAPPFPRAGSTGAAARTGPAPRRKMHPPATRPRSGRQDAR